jgi:hypothetical protein
VTGPRKVIMHPDASHGALAAGRITAAMPLPARG